MLAFHSEPAIKEKYLARVRQHLKADQIVQGYGYWIDGKGCAVGCTVHGDDHAAYESELGVPQVIAHLEDAIFEGLFKELARLWPEQFLSAIPVGADLSLVWHHFAAWLLRSDLLTITDANRDAIDAVAALHVRAASGASVSSHEWSAASDAASDAAAAAASAADSAADSAAWRYATSAAASTADRRFSAWRSAAWGQMAAKLLALLASAPVRSTDLKPTGST